MIIQNSCFQKRARGEVAAGEQGGISKGECSVGRQRWALRSSFALVIVDVSASDKTSFRTNAHSTNINHNLHNLSISRRHKNGRTKTKKLKRVPD
jgi:hypothetical protein